MLLINNRLNYKDLIVVDDDGGGIPYLKNNNTTEIGLNK